MSQMQEMLEDVIYNPYSTESMGGKENTSEEGNDRSFCDCA